MSFGCGRKNEDKNVRGKSVVGGFDVKDCANLLNECNTKKMRREGEIPIAGKNGFLPPPFKRFLVRGIIQKMRAIMAQIQKRDNNKTHNKTKHEYPDSADVDENTTASSTSVHEIDSFHQ